MLREIYALCATVVVSTAVACSSSGSESSGAGGSSATANAGSAGISARVAGTAGIEVGGAGGNAGAAMMPVAGGAGRGGAAEGGFAGVLDAGQAGASGTGASGRSGAGDGGGAAGSGASGLSAGQAGTAGVGPNATECSEGGTRGFAGPPTTSGPTPQLDWAVTVAAGTDFQEVELVGLEDGGSLIHAGHCGGSESGDVLVRVGPDGAFEWEACVPEGAREIMPNGNILAAGDCPTKPVPGFEPAASPDPSQKCVCEVDQQSGAVLAANVMDPDPSPDMVGSGSLLVDESGFFTKRQISDRSYILRYSFDGALLWSVEHADDLHGGGEALHPDGGVVVVGVGGDWLDEFQVRHVDTDGNNVSQTEYSYSTEPCLPGDIQAVAVSPAGRVAVVGLVEPAGCGNPHLVWVEPDGTIRNHVLAPGGDPWGVSFVSEDEVAVWTITGGWALRSYGADGELRWEWRLDAEDGVRGGASTYYSWDFNRSGTFLFVGDAYRGTLDLGSEELTSNGCVNAFLLRFSL